MGAAGWLPCKPFGTPCPPGEITLLTTMAGAAPALRSLPKPSVTRSILGTWLVGSHSTSQSFRFVLQNSTPKTARFRESVSV